MKTFGCFLESFPDFNDGFFRMRFVAISTEYARIIYSKRSKRSPPIKIGILSISPKLSSRKCHGYPMLNDISAFPDSKVPNGN